MVVVDEMHMAEMGDVWQALGIGRCDDGWDDAFETVADMSKRDHAGSSAAT